MINEYIQKAEKYLQECVFDGLAHSYDVITNQYIKPYPEVTGYVLKYFCDNYKELPQNILEAGNKLVEIQDGKVGGYSTFDNNELLYTFDTSQILIGLIALYKKTGVKKYKIAAIKAGKFLLMMQLENGAILPIYDNKSEEVYISNQTYSIWNGPWSGLMCKITEGFQALYELTGEKGYLIAKIKAGDFYVKANYIECTHPLGYWLEGLYEAKKYEKVNSILENKVIPRIKDNGFISYKEDLNYAYVSGVIQLGIILYKMGYTDEAKKIREFGRCVQRNDNSGGIFQYADFKGNLDYHVHTEINSWGTKYFCQLERLLEEKK